VATSGGRERVRELAPVVVVQSRVRLDEERLLLIFRVCLLLLVPEFGGKLTGRWIGILVESVL
jgi:hypothetical protein